MTTHEASQQGIETRFINLTDQVNREMPTHVTGRVIKLLNDTGVPLSESKILVLGGSYKPDVPDTRESPAYDIIENFEEYDADVSFHDPLVSEIDVGHETYQSQELTAEVLNETDCTVILTNHSAIDIEFVVRESPLVFDTRNATERFDNRDNIVPL